MKRVTTIILDETFQILRYEWTSLLSISQTLPETFSHFWKKKKGFPIMPCTHLCYSDYHSLYGFPLVSPASSELFHKGTFSHLFLSPRSRHA